MCIFCKIIDAEIPCFKLYEDDLVIAYLDINPFTLGHTLVVPKKHSEGLLDTDPTVLAEIIKRVQHIAAHLKTALPCDGFNVLQNNGECAGQTVHHLHFHIVPRYNNDAQTNITFANHTGDMAALAALAERIKL